ncbi:hypothetical protein MFUL124B02_20745 [Myxococcus fulvus 124B02]|nr:hypothetical protein MFUL124B02_20745 [Myxococcus fulvus 124B02]
MKNLTGVLVFSTTLLLMLGCHKNTGETAGPADAATQPSAEATAPAEATKPVDSGSTLEAPAAGAEKTGTDSGTLVAESPDASTPAAGTNLKDAGAPESRRAALESCVDRWLKKKNLDPYGNKEGTMYAGGTPLFDERTGESTDRMEFIFRSNPEARKVCMQPSSR